MFWNRRRRPGTRPGSVPSARAATPRAAAVPPPPVVAAARAAAEALETRWYLASVAGYVYNDLDANGSRDGSEPGLAGYEVVLSDGSSEPLSCTTDGDGRYAFTALPTGQTFSLSVAPSAPFHATSASSATVYLGGEGDFGGPEFGWSAASSASGTVVFDLDGTGTYSAADASVGDVRVYADTNLNGQYDEGEASTLTAADGTFELGNIPLPPPMSSVYIGVVAPDGWSASAWGGNVFDPGTSASGIVFGCMSSVSGWVSGAVYDDANANGANDAEAGLDGLTVTLTAANGYTASTSTSMGGQYWFGGLTARTYTITVTSPDNWNPTTSNLVAATVTGSSPSPSAPAVGLNYRPLPAPVAHVSGTVYDDRDADGARQAGEPGLAGVAVYATEVGWSGADGYGAMYYAYTDGDGRYAFDNLSPNGDYQITVAGPSDRRPTSGSGSAYVYSVPAGAPGVTGIDQGWTRGMITGYAADSANGWPWLPGIPVTLTDSTGQTVGTAVTDASGAYRFTDLDPYGSYYVAGAEVAGYRATGPVGPVTLYGGDLTGYATVYMVPAPVTASGAVYEDVDGDFLVGAGDSASSGWTVYADENGNGLRDGGEPWAVTGEDGTYALSNLLAAYTMIRLEPRAGWNDPSLTQQMGQGAFYGSVAGLNIFVRRPPATPTGLAAAATSAGVAVAWADQSSNETGFEVQRAADAAFAQGVQSFATGATAYADETTAGTRRYYYRVRAVNAGGASAWSPAAALVTPPRGAATLPDFPDGFPTGANATAAGAGLALNGGASVDPATGDLRVVPGTPGWTQAGSAWFARRVDVTRFDTTFRFTAGGDGLAFVVQAHAPEAIGNPVGGDMGYQGIPDSVAVKIDTGWGYWSYNNTTGLYVGGQPPTNPEVSLAAGVDPTAGHPCEAHVVYDGIALALTVTDLTTGAVSRHSFPVDVPAAIGGHDTAWVGFTGSEDWTGQATRVSRWTYAVPPAAPKVRVEVGGEAPATAGGPTAVDEGRPVVARLSSSHAAGVVDHWAVDWDGAGGGEPEVVAGTATWARHTYADDSGGAAYQLSVTAFVPDGDGGFVADGSGSTPVLVRNVAPTLLVSRKATAVVGQPYTVTLTAADPGADQLLGWTVKWGDGDVDPVTPSVGGGPVTATHTYREAGSEPLKVTAWDEDVTSATPYDAVVGGLDAGFDGGVTSGTTAGLIRTDLSALVAPYLPWIGGITGDWAAAVAAQPDGKVVVAATASGPAVSWAGQYPGAERVGLLCVLRYLPDGTLDPTFNPDPDGAGPLAPANGPVPGVAVSTNGWGWHQWAASSALSVAVGDDGKIWVAGGNSVGGNYLVTRWTADGGPDPAFGGGSGLVDVDYAGPDFGTKVIPTADGGATVMGHSGYGLFTGLRLLADGSMDPAWAGGGVAVRWMGTSAVSSDAAVLPDGRVVQVGSTFGAPRVVRYGADGSADYGWDSPWFTSNYFGGTRGDGRAVAVDAAGRIVIAGVTEVGGDRRFAVARLVAATGAWDPTFGDAVGGGSPARKGYTTTKFAAAVPTAATAFDGAGAAAGLFVQADGKLLVVGSATVASADASTSVSRTALVRYNADGTLDATFGTGGDAAAGGRREHVGQRGHGDAGRPAGVRRGDRRRDQRVRRGRGGRGAAPNGRGHGVAGTRAGRTGSVRRSRHGFPGPAVVDRPRGRVGRRLRVVQGRHADSHRRRRHPRHVR